MSLKNGEPPQGWVTEQGTAVAFNCKRKTGLSGIQEYRLVEK